MNQTVPYGDYNRRNIVTYHKSLSWCILFLMQAEGSSAESIATLAKVDTVKRRMESAYETLQAMIFFFFICIVFPIMRATVYFISVFEKVLVLMNQSMIIISIL